jgi:hypothetical protein
MRMTRRRKRKLRRRREQRQRLSQGAQDGRDAATGEREALIKYYWHEIRRCVFVLNEPLAWELALEVKTILDIDLTPRLVDLLHNLMKPVRPKAANAKVAKLVH